MMTEAEREERVAELAEEYLACLRAGSNVSVESFAAQHPECAEDLLELLPAMMDMEGLSQASRPQPVVSVSFPESLGGYRLLEKIGVGGMGTVFRALQVSLNREVAVKVLSPSWSSDARHLRAFENESRVIAGLRHTNIVEVYGAGCEGEYRYYVMSLVRGKSLNALAVQLTFPDMSYDKAVAHVGFQAARGLAFAHEHGVVHRDVKPGNLLLDEEGVVHVSDFGLATVLNAGEAAPLVTQSHDGTLRYMAPERLTRGENSFACDQYALGLTLYELLTKRAAFKETEPGQLIHRICHEALPPLRGAGDLGAIINKSISFSPEDRYPSMQEMVEDLRRYLAGEPVRARAVSHWRRYWMWVRRRPAVAVWSHAAALLVVLLLVSVSIGYVRVSHALTQENAQRELAEKNAQIADAAIQRMLQSVSDQPGTDTEFLHVTKEDLRLIQDLLPYYEEIAAQDEGSSDKVGRAFAVLAGIALKTGDYGTAEEYYRRAAEICEPGSLEAVKIANGLAASLHAQKGVAARREAQQVLERVVASCKDGVAWPVRLELVKSVQLLMAYRRAVQESVAPDGGGVRFGNKGSVAVQESRAHGAAAGGGRVRRGAARMGGAVGKNGGGFGGDRMGDGTVVQAGSPLPKKVADPVLMRSAAELLVGVLAEQPHDVEAQLRRAELLSLEPEADVREMLAPNKETPLAIVEQVLKENPASEAAKRAFVQIVSGRYGYGVKAAAQQADLLNRADAYAQSLLASNPGDSGLLMAYLRTRQGVENRLVRAGEKEMAEVERERTLGVVQLLTSRDEVTPEFKNQLVRLLSRDGVGSADHEALDEDIKALLRSHEEQRRGVLRNRMRQIRSEHPRPNRRAGGGIQKRGKAGKLLQKP